MRKVTDTCDICGAVVAIYDVVANAETPRPMFSFGALVLCESCSEAPYVAMQERAAKETVSG